MESNTMGPGAKPPVKFYWEWRAAHNGETLHAEPLQMFRNFERVVSLKGEMNERQ